jgi:hypothetical protein
MTASISGRLPGLFMPAAFILAIIFCLVRVGETATNEYFVKKPSLKWEDVHSGQPHAALIWAAADMGASWKVRYHVPKTGEWQTALVHVARRMKSELFTQQLVYDAELSGMEPGSGGEYEVYRNEQKVYSAHIR